MSSSSTVTLPPYQAAPESPTFSTPSLQTAYNEAIAKWKGHYQHEAIMKHGGNVDMLSAAVLQEIEASANASAAQEVAEDVSSSAVSAVREDRTDEEKTPVFPNGTPGAIGVAVIVVTWLVATILWLVFIYKKDQTCLQKYNTLYQQCQAAGWGECKLRAQNERDDCFWGPWYAFWSAIWSVLSWVLTVFGVLMVVSVVSVGIAAGVSAIYMKLSERRQERKRQEGYEMTNQGSAE